MVYKDVYKKEKMYVFDLIKRVGGVVSKLERNYHFENIIEFIHYCVQSYFNYKGKGDAKNTYFITVGSFIVESQMPLLQKEYTINKIYNSFVFCNSQA